MMAKGLADTAPSDAVIAPYLAASIEEFKNRVGWGPFLEEVSADWRYDPAEYGDYLDLNMGFTAISAVRTGLTYSDSTGTLLTAERDYLLEPYDARAKNRPYTRIQFLVGMGSGSKSIKVTGTRGFDDEIPDDVWAAVLGQGVVKAVEGLTENAGDVEEIKQGQVTIKYNVEDGGSILTKLSNAFESVVSRYERMVM